MIKFHASLKILLISWHRKEDHSINFVKKIHAFIYFRMFFIPICVFHYYCVCISLLIAVFITIFWVKGGGCSKIHVRFFNNRKNFSVTILCDFPEKLAVKIVVKHFEHNLDHIFVHFQGYPFTFPLAFL